MPKAHEAWTVRPHGNIIELADNLWWTWGSLPGMSLKRAMTVVRLSSGELVIHNGIALDEREMQRIEAWGTPAYLVVPNGAHRLDAPAYRKRYPALKVLAPKGSRRRVEEVIAVDMSYEEFTTPNDEVKFEYLHGVNEGEGAMIVRSSDGVTVVLNDALFNMDKKSDFLGYLFTTLLGSAPGPRVSRLAKLVFIKDQKALRADFERYADLPGLVRLIVAHEKVASGPAAREALLEASKYLS